MFRRLVSREKAESEVKSVTQKVDEAVQNANQCVRVERLVTSCHDAMTKAIRRQDQFPMTLKVDDSASLPSKGARNLVELSDDN